MPSHRFVADAAEAQALLRGSLKVQQDEPGSALLQRLAGAAEEPFVAFLTCPGDDRDPCEELGLRPALAYWVQAPLQDCGEDVAAAAEWAEATWGVPLLVILAHHEPCRFSPGECGLAAARRAVSNLHLLLGLNRRLAIVVARRNAEGRLELDGPAPPDMEALQMCRSRKIG